MKLVTGPVTRAQACLEGTRIGEVRFEALFRFLDQTLTIDFQDPSGAFVVSIRRGKPLTSNAGWL